MAAENGLESTSRGRTKKKSPLTKLVERKKRQQVGASDVDSEYGSRVSIQNNRSSQGESTVPLEPEVIVERKSSFGSSCVPCNSGKVSDLQDKPRPRPRRNSKTAASDGVASAPVDAGPVKLGQGDGGSDPQASSRSVPTDSTIHRFRKMRMASEQSDGADIKLQGPFVPKPPSTPRTPRSAAVKGEKRNHEPTSSGDEPEVDPKRQMPGKSDGEVVSKDAVQQGLVQEVAGASLNHSPKMSPGRSSVDRHDAEDPANETMNQLHSQYMRLMDEDSSKDSPLHVRRGSFGYHTHDSAMSTPRSGRLAPLQVKSTPPPMETDVASHALRTAYKRDPSYRPSSSGMIGHPNKAMSVGAPMGRSGSHVHLGSDNLSLSSASVMPVITTKEARSRSVAGQVIFTMICVHFYEAGWQGAG